MAPKKTPPKKPVPPEFHASQRLQRSYEQGIREIAGRVFVKKRQDQSFTEWLAELAERSRSKDVQDASELLARRMIINVNVGNQRTWREAASRSSQAQKLHRLLQAEMQGPTGSEGPIAYSRERQPHIQLAARSRHHADQRSSKSSAGRRATRHDRQDVPEAISRAAEVAYAAHLAHGGAEGLHRFDKGAV